MKIKTVCTYLEAALVMMLLLTSAKGQILNTVLEVDGSITGNGSTIFAEENLASQPGVTLNASDWTPAHGYYSYIEITTAVHTGGLEYGSPMD